MVPITRRRFLLGSAGVAGLAGCSSVLGPVGVRLHDVWLNNYTDEPQTFDLRVEADGLPVHRESHEVGVTANAIEGTRASAEVEVQEFSDVVVSVQVEDRRAVIDFASDPYVDEYDGHCVLCVFSYDARGQREVRPRPRTVPDDTCASADDELPQS